MINPAIQRKYKEAIELYGQNIQMLIAIEEMAELTKELVKFQRGEVSIEKITSEMTDVKIMLEQLETMFDNSNELKAKYAAKIIRLADRIYEDKMERSEIHKDCIETLTDICKKCAFYQNTDIEKAPKNYCAKGFWEVY